jgi:hypothetical protein
LVEADKAAKALPPGKLKNELLSFMRTRREQENEKIDLTLAGVFWRRFAWLSPCPDRQGPSITIP